VSAGGTGEAIPLLYGELAEWWPLLSPPEDYADDAARIRGAFHSAGVTAPATILELGSGGGHLSSHLARDFAMTLVDIAPTMLALSRRLNPECEHLEGDLTTLRLGRTFDGVLIHDAICHLTTADDLARAFATAHTHLRPGGVAVFAPDHTRETFEAGVDHIARDDGERGLRFFEWTWDPDPADTEVRAEMVYLLREGSEVRCRHDTHRYGLFPRAEWLSSLEAAGFEAYALPSEAGSPAMRLFVGRRR